MAERTEAPTGKRLSEARNRGQVARSPELNTAVGLLVGFWLLQGSGIRLVLVMQSLVRQTMVSLPSGDLTIAWLRELIIRDALQILPDLSVFLLTMLVTGITVTVVQTGPMWASKNIGFDLSKLNPLTGLKRLFSSKGLIDLLRAILKLLVVGLVTYNYLSGRMVDLFTLGQNDIATGVRLWFDMAYNLGLRVGGAYLVLASADYLYQRWNLMRSLKMTKEEVKEENRQQEGDPFIKGQIRMRARRMARMRMMKKVPQAEVVITNPTHFAVALEYRRDSMHAPRVVAKGAALIAQRIKEIARENNVPVVENPPVARALYSAVEIDQEVPPELYVAVAEVFAFIYNMKAKRQAAAYPYPPRLPGTPATTLGPDVLAAE
jgi:flagellar biosynthesis protein FlhB